MLHIDFVRKNLGPAVNVYGVMESGMWLDIEPEPKAVRSGRLSLKQETIVRVLYIICFLQFVRVLSA
jgi:hypothetical protein